MKLDRAEVLAVFAGGVVGAVARTILVRSIHHDPAQWPWATFIANVVGALVLGAVAVRFAPGTPRRGLLGTGFCGALTTFSTLQLELFDQLDAGHAGLAFGYAAASLATGLAAVALGDRLARGRVT